MTAEADSFDPDRILAALDAHDVDYLLVGGLAARAHGAQRRTADVDCVPSAIDANVERLAAALRSLNARLRVGGMSDDEASRLPVTVDAATLRSFGSSTWMTDAGPLDVLAELRVRDGGRHGQEDLLTRSVDDRVGPLTVSLASLDDIIASKEFAGRDKDLEGLPELRELQQRNGDRCHRTSTVQQLEGPQSRFHDGLGPTHRGASIGEFSSVEYARCAAERSLLDLSHSAMSVDVRVLAASEWVLWRDVTLQSLADSPDAFRPTLAEASVQPERFWRGMVVQTVEHERSSLWVAVSGDDLVPKLFARIDEELTTVYVGAMRVAPDARGAGVGGRLMQAAEAWGEDRGVTRCELCVTEANQAAVRFYESLGYVPTDTIQMLREGSELRVRKLQKPI